MYEITNLLNSNTWKYLDTFFKSNGNILNELKENIDDIEWPLDHVWIEVHEPIGLIEKWFEKLQVKFNERFGSTINITNKIIFSASDAFQNIMWWKVDIMRIYLEVCWSNILLELFDVESPISVITNRSKLRLWKIQRLTWPLNRWFKWLLSAVANNVEWVRDTVRHDAIMVKNYSSVQRIHDVLQDFSKANTWYLIKYNEPIINKWDNSIHTKIMNLCDHTELEFVHVSD